MGFLNFRAPAMNLCHPFSPHHFAWWAQLLLDEGLKHDRTMILVHGPGGITSWAPGGPPKESEILEKYPMPDGWKDGDGLPPGFRF